MKLRHNKKRNTAFIFESLVKEMTKAVFQKNELVVGDVVHFCSDLQFIVGRITEIDNKISIEWDFPIVLNKTSKRNPLIIQLEASPRIMGFGIF